MSITSWTSEDMNWSSVDTIRLGSPILHLEAIRLALVERVTAAKYTIVSPYTELLSPFTRLSSPSVVASKIQYVISQLIPKFVNFADNSGNWNGVLYSAFAPLWTESSLLAYIGASERLEAPPLDVSAEWAYQQYQILNTLRWRKNVSRVSGHPDGQAMYAGGDVKPSWYVAYTGGYSWINQYDIDYYLDGYLREDYTDPIFATDSVYTWFSGNFVPSDGRYDFYPGNWTIPDPNSGISEKSYAIYCHTIAKFDFQFKTW